MKKSMTILRTFGYILEKNW